MPCEQLQEEVTGLMELGVIGEISEGFAIPPKYYFIGEMSGKGTVVSGKRIGVKRNPKFRGDLIRLLNEFGD